VNGRLLVLQEMVISTEAQHSKKAAVLPELPADVKGKRVPPQCFFSR
jgi:hypothetical protein